MNNYKKLKKLLPVLLLLPVCTFGHELILEQSSREQANSKLYFEISSTALLILHPNSSKAIIIHKDIIDDTLVKPSAANRIEPVGVQFHEE